MPRYNITISASNQARPPSTRRTWANTDDGAIAYAKQWLAIRHGLNESTACYDEWQVWQGNPPYSPHRTVAAGSLQARA